MIAPYLFANADQNLPVRYVNLLFEPEITQRHVVVATFALTQNCTDKLYLHLLETWEQKYETSNLLRNSFAVKALYLSLCHVDKNTLKAKIASGLNLATINEAPQL